MSTIYVTEPPTKGKVLLKTTLGDVDIELWSKEAPKACRNFVQLCLEGYYDDTIFHRVIKNFIAQGGDPTGTGEGGESIYGEPFPDEFHSRLRFNRRGLVAMASSGPCTNNSQFFITLDKTEDLQRKHTIFGKITGETVFNVLRLNDYEVDENDRPLFPPKVISVEVLSNPFEDIVPREKPKPIEPVVEEKAKPVKKNLNLLSFGDEDELEESAPTGMKSSHHFPSKMLAETIQKRKEMGLDDNQDAYPATVNDTAQDKKGTSTKHKSKKQRKNFDEEDGEVPVEEVAPTMPTREKRRSGNAEKSLSAQLDKFRKNLKSTAQNEDDEWKNHSLVFEKQVNRIDPFNREKDDGYTVYDPLKSQKDQQKHSNANFHQRRLTAVKNTEKW